MTRRCLIGWTRPLVDGYNSLASAAKREHVSKALLREAIHARIIRAKKVGNAFRIPYREMNTWLRTRPVSPAVRRRQIKAAHDSPCQSFCGSDDSGFIVGSLQLADELIEACHEETR